MNTVKLKILTHIIVIICFLISIVFIHVVLNTIASHLLFFGMLINRVIVLDSALTLIGIAFFTEFYMSFKQIEVK